MSRYFLAFSFATLLYSSVIASIFYFLGNDDEVTQADEPVVTKTVAISMIKQECHHKKKKIEKQVPKKEVKKVVKKEKQKPKVVEKVIKKEIAQEEKPKEKVKKPVEELAVSEKIEEPVVQEEEVTQEEEENLEESLREQQMQEMLLAKQKELDRFTLQLVKKINENKRYPLSARRRGVEGNVDVKFIVLANGGVDAIKIIKGKSIFKRSTMEAIEKSFPVDLEKSLLDFPKEFQIKLVYVLK